MKILKLVIFTPFGKYLEEDVDFIKVQTTNYLLGILPGHAPLISDVAISILEINMKANVYKYAVGGGMININEGKVTLMLDSIEAADDIDILRAKAAKERAEKRLSDKAESLDSIRAELALKRANNRIKLFESKK